MNTDSRDPKTYDIIGAAMAVHRALGHGFLEAVYQSALKVEFTARSIPFRSEAPLNITYRGTLLPLTYRVDFVCFGDVIVELKALARLSGRDEAQTIHYLKASGHARGLLINFGAPSLEYRRVALSREGDNRSADYADYAD